MEEEDNGPLDGARLPMSGVMRRRRQDGCLRKHDHYPWRFDEGYTGSVPGISLLRHFPAVRDLRTKLHGRALSMAVRLGDDYMLELDYPPSAVSEPRYGHGSPPRPLLATLLAAHDRDYAAALRDFARFQDDYAQIPVRGTDSLEPGWVNDWFPGLDAVSLYGLVRSLKPGRYVEIGSGVSTAFVARARRDGGLDTHLRSVDPHPRQAIDALCDEVIRRPLELAGMEAFSDIEPGDLVFFDGSHRVFMNSDVTCFFLDILPQLPSGVYVGIHDIYLPDDYPAGISDRYYSEQYMLAVALLAGSHVRPILPCWYVHTSAQFANEKQQLWRDARLRDVPHHGAAFWLQTADNMMLGAASSRCGGPSDQGNRGGIRLESCEDPDSAP